MATNLTTTIDDEWSNFITNKYNDETSDDEKSNLHDEIIDSDDEELNSNQWDKHRPWDPPYLDAHSSIGLPPIYQSR